MGPWGTRLALTGRVLALALTVALAAAPTGDVNATGPEPAFTPRAIVYTYPLTALGVGALNATGMKAAWIPLGVSVPLRADLSFDAEGSVGVLGFGSGFGTGWSLSLSAGPTWYPFTGERVLGGFFVGPRFQLMTGEATRLPVLFASGGSGPVDVGPSVRRSFLVGFDLGWQFRYRRLTFGPVFGAGVGYTFDSNSAFANPFETTIFGNVGRPDTFAVGVNFNVFRLGVSL